MLVRASKHNFYKFQFTYHDCSPFGVDGEILSWYNASASAFAKRFLMDFFKNIFGRDVLENDDTTRVGTDDDVIFGSAGEPERHQRSYYTKSFNRQESMNFAGIGIRAQKLQRFAPGYKNLLHFAAREISMDGMGYAGGTLQSQIVEIHGVELSSFDVDVKLLS